MALSADVSEPLSLSTECFFIKLANKVVIVAGMERMLQKHS